MKVLTIKEAQIGHLYTNHTGQWSTFLILSRNDSHTTVIAKHEYNGDREKLEIDNSSDIEKYALTSWQKY